MKTSIFFVLDDNNCKFAPIRAYKQAFKQKNDEQKFENHNLLCHLDSKLQFYNENVWQEIFS